MANTLLNYDTQGFIIGLRRVEQQTKGVQRDTNKIIQILTEQGRQAEHQFQQQQRQQPRPQRQSNRRSEARPEHQIQQRQQRQQQRQEQRQQRVERQQQRDEQGRFSRQAEAKEQNSQLSQMLAEQFNNVLQQNADGLDPVLDSLNEVRDMFSPLANGLGMMWKGGMWSAQKLMKFRRQEPRSREERTHDDAVEEQLENIARNTQNASGGGGLFGGLFGRLFGRGGLFTGGILGALATGLTKFFKGKGFLGAILGAGGLALNWDKLSFDEKGQGIGRVGGMVAGGLAGAAAGSVLGPIGTIIGGLAGAYFGGDAGETLAKVAIPQIQSWTTQLKNYNLAGKIKGLWDNVTTKISNAFSSVPDHVKAAFDGAIEFIKNGFGKGLEAGKGLWGSFKDTAKNFISGLPGGQAVLDMVGAGTSSEAASGAVIDSNMSKTQAGRQEMVFNSFRKAGFSHNEALALTAEVGRENGYQDKYLFGTHRDAGNGKLNAGMISWQGDRRTALMNHLRARGVLDAKGNMIHGQKALDAQAEFVAHELRTSHKTAGNLMRANQHLGAEALAAILGKKYIVWAYGQDRINKGKTPFDWRKHDAKRRGYLQQISKRVGSGQTTSTQKANTAQPTANQSHLVAIMGDYRLNDTGTGSSDHYDLRVAKKAGKPAEDINKYLDRFMVNGKTLNQYKQTGKFMEQRNGYKHEGVDYGFNGSFGGDKNARRLYTNPQYAVKAIKHYYDKKAGWITQTEFADGVKINTLHQNKAGAEEVVQSFKAGTTKKPTVTPPKPPAVKAPTTKPPQSPPKIEIGKRTGTERIITSQNTPQQITQNISDRNLAHAITGGLGMDRYAV